MAATVRWLTILALACALTACGANGRLEQIEQGAEDVQQHSQAIQDEARAK